VWIGSGARADVSGPDGSREAGAAHPARVLTVPAASIARRLRRDTVILKRISVSAYPSSAPR
jgi:hypothetical protein